MAQKKHEQDFVVTDRRRFGAEGELRTDVPVTEEERLPAAPPASTTQPPAEQTQPPAQPTPPPAQQLQPLPETPPAATAPADGSEELATPPTTEQQQQQTEDYKALGKKLQDMFAARGAQAPTEIAFEQLVEFFYTTAAIQL